MKKVLLIISLTWVLTNASKADSYSGTSYNWSTGEYNNVDVSFNGSELAVYNYNTGEYEWHDIDSNNGSGSFKLIIGKLVSLIQLI